MPRAEVDPAIAIFNEALGRSLGRLEETAAIAAGEIAAEVDEVVGNVGNAEDGRLIEGFGRHLSEYAAGIAEACERIRAEITAGTTAMGADDHSRADGEGSNEPETSEGARMLILQMAAAGADLREIEARLAAFGMDHQRETIERILSDPLA